MALFNLVTDQLSQGKVEPFRFRMTHWKPLRHGSLVEVYTPSSLAETVEINAEATSHSSHNVEIAAAREERSWGIVMFEDCFRPMPIPHFKSV
ncbi:hypothetical protein PYH37_001725 [Sinorhizobium numidicum]|uniref:Uncharacterized protein n=1 Tax=Sinorhizobium numidicum TaxID=680248 RepID=A0ABY8CTH7_9HYPH|nr:hypothetical protein [Sinorhizobium numidicum]WEX74320.1 hypothetical protein PYH37_001725 [Sinorhizobium numidicum]WEX80306.1 hypothetical protein PYH38_001726 [Sinorhizobium numidicum]